MHGTRTHVRLISLAIAIALVSGSIQAATDSPYVVAKKDFKKRVKSVSLAPLSAPEMLELSDATRALIEAEAAKRLSKGKFEITPIEPYAQLRMTLANQIGGLTTADGIVDPRRKAAVWDHAKREMRHRYPIDAFAEISVRVVSALFTDDRAEWDGVRQKVVSSGDGFSLFGGKNYQGTIAAVSFQLAFFDRSDELLFVNRGGIDVMQERQGAALVVRPAGVLLQDEKKIRKAIQLAFKGL